MSTFRVQASPQLRRTGRRFGYVVAIVVNVVGLIIVNNVLEWGWLPFLTDDFATVVPWMNVSLTAALAVNVAYLFWDGWVFRSATRIGLNLITVVVTYQVLRVFPFDFGDYSFNWGVVLRILLIVGMVGASIGVLTEMYHLVRGSPTDEREVTDGNRF